MSLLELFSPTQLIAGVLLGYALPTLLLSLQTRYLLQSWKSHARSDLPILAACHFAPGPARCHSWPTRADALPRYFVCVLPVLNAFVLAVVLLMLTMALIDAVRESRIVSEWLRQPL